MVDGAFADDALGDRLENYTLKFPREVLLVNALIGEEADTVIIFKGFSSSLVRPTDYDPEVPTLPKGARIESISRLEGPYVPEAPKYIQRDMSLEAFTKRLDEYSL